MDLLSLAVGALAGGVLLKTLEPLPELAVTKHGANPFTVSAAVRALLLAPYWLYARALIAGTITSAYRSERVNALAGGVANSDHLKGLAVDIVPTGDYWAAVRRLREACERGQLGSVRQFIAESHKRVVHLGYYDPLSPERGATSYLEQTAPGTHRALEA